MWLGLSRTAHAAVLVLVSKYGQRRCRAPGNPVMASDAWMWLVVIMGRPFRWLMKPVLLLNRQKVVPAYHASFNKRNYFVKHNLQ